jgi:5S rRNA maturation endonuclease (ribonuclease M5)
LEGVDKAHDFLLKSPDILRAFQEKRNLSLEYIKRKRIGYYVQHTAFTVPVFDAKGDLVNIRFHKITGSQKWGLRHKPVKILYDVTSFKKDAEEVWVCEGEGDFWVLEGIMGLNAVTSIGGALTIPDVIQENIELFRNKRIILALDNDEVGVMATAKLRLALGTDNVFRIDWPENFPTKGDVRDFITGA